MRRTQTGAWIETIGMAAAPAAPSVAPKRVRGLKLHELAAVGRRVESHPNGCVD